VPAFAGREGLSECGNVRMCEGSVVAGSFSAGVLGETALPRRACVGFEGSGD
jgi:hypothetical protein